jgi:DNA-binding NtrC family response regulator
METIYLVEDDPDCADVMRLYLESNKFNIRCFSSYDDAYRNMDGPCIILMDLHVSSKMSAEEFIKEVRRTHPGIKIVVVSGHANLEKAARDLNTDGWIKKPYDIHDIERLVSEHCNRASA